nr:ribonuclease H-like domain, reverse transcriptase, RNA-dependent DNA polymerase [Tanacetum cinerariifolium]
MLVQVYVDDIMFGSTRKDWCEEFETLLQSEFKMSSIGPLTFFLGLQVDQRPDGIFIHQENNYAGAHEDRKSTTGGCQFLRRRLISWKCKKQTIVATSSCEAEYVAAASCCGQWFLFTSAGRVTFCWLFPIPAGDLVSAAHMLFLLAMYFSCWLYIRYALIANPTIYASVVRQFWGSASEVSLRDGLKGLVATIDGTAYTVTEASIRSDLQLDDLNAIDIMTNAKNFAGLRDISRTKFLMYPQFLQNILDTDTDDTTPYPTPLVTKKIFANMRHYQGPDMPLLAHMLNQGEPAFVQAQQQEVSPPPPSPMVAPHPLPNPLPSPPRQSSPLSIPFGPAPSSRVVSSKPIPDIPSSSKPYKPVLATITSPIRGDDTGGGSFHESRPRPPPATPTISPIVGGVKEPLTLASLLALFPTCLQRIATLKAELKAISTECSFQQSSSGLDFTDAAIPAGELDSAGRVDSAGELYSTSRVDSAVGQDSAGRVVSAGGVYSADGLISTGVSVAAGPTVPAEPLSPIRYPSKGKAVAPHSLPITAPTAKELPDQ